MSPLSDSYKAHHYSLNDSRFRRAHQVKEIAPYLPNDSRKSGSEEFLYACWPAAVCRVILYVIHPLKIA